MKNPTDPIQHPHCSDCGSTDVLFDAYAEWDHENQCFTVQNIMDKGHQCNTCEGPCSIQWKDAS